MYNEIADLFDDSLKNFIFYNEEDKVIIDVDCSPNKSFICTVKYEGINSTVYTTEPLTLNDTIRCICTPLNYKKWVTVQDVNNVTITSLSKNLISQVSLGCNKVAKIEQLGNYYLCEIEKPSIKELFTNEETVIKWLKEKENFFFTLSCY